MDGSEIGTQNGITNEENVRPSDIKSRLANNFPADMFSGISLGAWKVSAFCWTNFK